MNHTIDSKTLRCLIKTGRSALDGDSNDAEHDALYLIIEALEALTSEHGKSPNIKSIKNRALLH